MGKGCDFCRDPLDGESWFPMYGVAPHECYWRKGPEFTIGQSTLKEIHRTDCFVPDLSEGGWDGFKYPSACGIFYCPNCQQDKYKSAWALCIKRNGNPPDGVFSE